MTNVLIVDDEVIFRNSLKTMLNWGKYGFSICGEASDGLVAKERIQELRPDIVITDIKMPVLDGLSLIAYINEFYPNTQVIALSGYEDFEYVRESMKNGVVDYLLKHRLNSESLYAVVMAAQDNIKLQHKKHEWDEKIKEQLAYGQKAICQEFFTQLLAGDITDKQAIQTKLTSLAIPLESKSLMLVVAEIDEINMLREKYSEYEWDELFNQLLEMVAKIVEDMGNGVVSAHPDSRFTIIFSMQKVHSMLLFCNHVYDCIRQIRTSIKRYYNITACYSISALCPRITEIHTTYVKASALLTDRLYRDADIILQDEAIPKQKNGSYTIDIKDEQAITHYLKTMEQEKLVSYINTIFNNIKQQHLDFPRVQIIFAGLINILSRAAREYGTDLATVCQDVHTIYEKLSRMNINEMNIWVVERYMDMLTIIENSGAYEHYHDVTKQACDYINRNFTHDISLNNIADKIGVTPSYLSRLFKEDIGKNLVEYLNCVRVEYAKRLIDENTKPKDLALRVGFNSNTYFCTVFKQVTGSTPMQYKEEHQP